MEKQRTGRYVREGQYRRADHNQPASGASSHGGAIRPEASLSSPLTMQRVTVNSLK